MRCYPVSSGPSGTFLTVISTLDITCPSTISIQNPGTLTSSTFDYYIDGSQPKFQIIPYTVDNPSCPISTYELFTDKTSNICVPDMICQYSQTATTIDFSVSVAKSTVAATYNFYVKITANGGSIGWASDNSATELFTLNVLCGPLTAITFQQNPSFISSTNVILDDPNSNIYTFFPPSTGSVVCPITSISLTGVTSTTSIIAQQPVSCIQPCIQVDLSATNILSTITFQLTTLIQGGKQDVSNVVTVNIICGIGSTTISPSVSAGSAIDINLGKSSPNNRYYFNEFVCSYPLCCQNGLTYTASSTSSLVAPTQHTSFSAVQWDPVLSQYFIEADTSAAISFDVYIHAQNEFLTAKVSPLIKVNILLCGPGSTLVIEGNFNNGKTALQIVDHNSVTMTRFYLPIFMVDNPNCPIISYLSSVSNLIYQPLNSGFVNDGQESSPGSGEYIVSPHDITIHSEYQFFIKAVSLSSDFVFSQLFTLVVGCTQSAEIKQSELFVLKSQFKASDSEIIYSIQDPQIDRNFCPILSHEIKNLEIKKQPSLQSKDIKFVCANQPCNKIKVENSGKPAQINFNIETRFEGELKFISQQIELLIIDNIQYPINYERHQDLLQFPCDLQSSNKMEELRKKINIEQNIAGQKIPVKSNEFLAYDMEIMPFIGKHIIKLDKENQVIRVSEYDSKFEGIYNLNLKIKCKEGINTTLKFQASFKEKLQFELIETPNNKTIKPYFMQVQNFTGRIQHIDIFGNVTVHFTEGLNYLNQTQLNQTLKLFIEPAPLTIDVLEDQDPNATFTYIEGRKFLESSNLLNFTWQVENQTDSSYLRLKVDFKNKLQVSAHDIIRDKLVLYITDLELFRSKKMSYIENRIIIKSLPKLMNDKILEVVALKNTGKLMDIVGIISFTTLAVNWLMQMMMSNIAGVFHNLQLLLYQTLINIQFPANVMYFLYFIKVIINSEIVDPGIITEKVFEFQGDEVIMNHLDNNEDKNHLLNEHFIEMGFENFNAIQNIGGIFFSLCYFIILVFLGILTFLILKSCECLFPKFRKAVNKDIEEEDKENIGKNEEESQLPNHSTSIINAPIITINKSHCNHQINSSEKRRTAEESQHLEGGSYEPVIQIKKSLALRSYIKLTQKHTDIRGQIMFRFIFMVVTENIFTFIVAGILWLNKNEVIRRFEIFNMSFEEGIFDVIGASLLLLSAIVVIVQIPLSIYAVYRLVRNQETQEQFEYVLKRINIDNNFELLYYLWFNVRRILICLTALYLQSYTGIQIIIFMLLNMLSTIYIALLRPFKEGFLNTNELVSETTTTLTSIIHCSFTQFNPDPITQYYTGWFYIGMIILNVLYFQYFHLKDSFRFVKLRLKKCKNQSRRKLKIDENVKPKIEDVQNVNIIKNEMVEIEEPTEQIVPQVQQEYKVPKVQIEQKLYTLVANYKENDITFGENIIEQQQIQSMKIEQNPSVGNLNDSSQIQDQMRNQNNYSDSESDIDVESTLQHYEEELGLMVRSYFEMCRKQVLDFARWSNYNDQYEKLFEFEKVRISFEKKAFDHYQKKYNEFLLENLGLQIDFQETFLNQIDMEIDLLIRNEQGIKTQLNKEIQKLKILSLKQREPQAIQFIDLVYSDELIEKHRDKKFTQKDYDEIQEDLQDMRFIHSFFEIKTLISMSQQSRVEAMKELANKYQQKTLLTEEIAERYAMIQYFYHLRKPKPVNQLSQLFEDRLIILIASKVSSQYHVIVNDNILSEQVEIGSRQPQFVKEHQQEQKQKSKLSRLEMNLQKVFAEGQTFEQQKKNYYKRISEAQQSQQAQKQRYTQSTQNEEGLNIFDQDQFGRNNYEESSESSN